jgi:hypothetical protein
MIGAVGMGVSQLIVGTLFAVYKNSWAQNPSAGWAAAVFIWIYISNFAFSIGKASRSSSASCIKLTDYAQDV